MGEGSKILVVDDEISLVQLCQLFLEEVGYVVRGAMSGPEALRLVEDELPDLILLDVMMPGMDGLETCRRIRVDRSLARPFILMYSADDRETTRQASVQAGANGFITKDTPIHELATQIHRYLALP